MKGSPNRSPPSCCPPSPLVLSSTTPSPHTHPHLGRNTGQDYPPSFLDQLRFLCPRQGLGGAFCLEYGIYPVPVNIPLDYYVPSCRFQPRADSRPRSGSRHFYDKKQHNSYSLSSPFHLLFSYLLCYVFSDFINPAVRPLAEQIEQINQCDFSFWSHR